MRDARVTATGSWLSPDQERLPSGEVHAWLPGQNSTVCGVQISRSRLHRFTAVRWADVWPESGRSADAVAVVCRRCEAAVGGRRQQRWTRTQPRP